MDHPKPTLRQELQFERIVFFSDAVFAIAITLLALELKLPEIGSQMAEQELAQAIQHLGLRFASFALSFLVIALFWIGHHRVFGFLLRFDYRLAWINLLLLFAIAFLPFPTAMLGDYGATRYATIFYAASVAAIGIFKALLWFYVRRTPGLVDPQLSPQMIRAENRSSIVSPAVFLLSIPIAFFNVRLAQIVWGVLALYYIFSEGLKQVNTSPEQ